MGNEEYAEYAQGNNLLLANQFQTGKAGGKLGMPNKGLCITCVHDKDCSFARKFPVLQCEEFSCVEPKSTSAKKKRKKVSSM